MVFRDEIIRYLNDYLQVALFKDFGPNGLQVEGRERISKIATAVSASVQLFERAAEINADMIIVHHGVLWNKDSRVVKGGYKRRLEILLSNQMALLAYHLPLDKHPVIGNNALAAEALQVKNRGEFADVGLMGDVKPCPLDVLLKNITDFYQSNPLVFAYGPEQIERIGICSGGAQRSIVEAIDLGLDAFITGESSEATMHLAQEGDIHFIAAGHYASERPGIQALGQHVAQHFEIPVEFIDIPNPV
jgi:dinuclear metal center YbgI/SA1388 family protein